MGPIFSARTKKVPTKSSEAESRGDLNRDAPVCPQGEYRFFLKEPVFSAVKHLVALAQNIILSFFHPRPTCLAERSLLAMTSLFALRRKNQFYLKSGLFSAARSLFVLSVKKTISP